MFVGTSFFCNVIINSYQNTSSPGTELAPNMGRSGIVSCDLITHDYLFIPGGMKDIADNSDLEVRIRKRFIFHLS